MRTLLTFLCALLAGVGAAAAADLKLLTTGAFKPVAMDMVPMFERATGHKVRVENATAGELARRIAGGEKFDVVVLTHQALERMVGQKRILDDSITPLAKVGVGVAVSLSASRPDISNVEAFRRTLLAARAIAYVDPASGGTSGIYLSQLFQTLGIASEVRAKSVMVVGGLAAQRVASGQADIALQQASELLLVPSVQFIGPLPASIQNYTVYSGAIGAQAQDLDAAGLLLEALAKADEVAVLRRKGMEVP
jgi:molybdate transport system substrate-binding protein